MTLEELSEWSGERPEDLREWCALGLVGGGGLIGKAVARRAHGFSMRVLYWTPRRKPESLEREAGLTFVPLDQLLAESDFVSLHQPLDATTRHQIGARELGLM